MKYRKGMSAKTVHEWLQESEKNRELFAYTEFALEIVETFNAHMKSNNIKRKTVARKFGISEKKLSHMLTLDYKMSVSDIARLALAMDCSPKLLMTRTDW